MKIEEMNTFASKLKKLSVLRSVSGTMHVL